ncbi:chromosome segregation protein SMC [Balneolales bacterium ANBcel1]|nr:chromosome segregation protein SMC [Balneolales bacterium ANBcel1]
MYLAELELHGFKSFAHKTKVKFDSGITSIVGPNGCGKSNIVDALRWVLGEQRPSLLRSAAMSNVIFNGTAAKKALGMAEVSVTIINNRGVLPTEFSDITMTRRLYRSGESEYLLNNKPCRLRDITDLFMDTGMGANAYSVIELKMVEEILNDKNNDRRKLFEEAAGITKFKERKKQTMKKLSDTRGDLQRMEDILVEVRKKTRSLQAQASRAERAQRYREELEFLDKAVSRQEYLDVRAELNPLLERIASATSTREELDRRLKQLEQNETEAHDELIAKEQALNELRQKTAGLTENIQEKRSEVQIITQKITNEENIIRGYEQDVYQAETDIKDLRKDLKANQAELKLSEEKLAAVREERDEAQVLLEKNRQEVNRVRAELEEVNRRHSDAGRRINELQNRRIRLESRLENNAEQKQRIERELGESREKINALEGEYEKLEGLHEALQAEYDDAELELERARKEREELFNAINRQKDTIRSLKSKKDAFESEHRLLKNLAQSSDAHPAGVHYLKEQQNAFTRLEILSDLFRSRDEDAAAVEAVLGEAANFVVTSNEEEAVRAFDMLREKDKGRVTIIPLNLVSGGHPVLENALYHDIRTDTDYEPLLRLFFGSVMLADDISSAVKLAGSESCTAVTRTGDVVTSDGFMYSGSSNQNAGIRIGLREKIERCLQQAEAAGREVELAETELGETEDAYQKFSLQPHQQKVKEAASALQKHEAKAGSFQTQSGFYSKSIQDLQRRMEELEFSTGEADRELEEITPQLKELESTLTGIVREEVSLKSHLQEKEDAQQRSQSRYNDISLKYQNAENEVTTLKRDIERFESDVQSIKDRLQHRADRARSSKDTILNLREQIEQAEDALRELLAARETAVKEQDQADEACSHQRGKINLLESDLKEVRNRKESNQDLFHSLEMAKSRLEMDQKNINDHIWDTYSLTVDQLNQQLPEDTDLSTARETIFTLKQRLKNIGEVNPLAITEYEEEKERLEHFEKQIGDLERAETQLIETIQEINRNAQERFNETFKLIRENFRTVFNTLFEENDHCDLVIDESADDPLEAKIEIIANPRGKRPSVIEQLSGGEKTLTAIALLFAIYLVKPSPFCVMDEVDAPLDDPNILRFTKLLKKFSEQTQFIVITHNKTTMEKSETMYGVTMPEVGISKLVGVRLDEVAA